MDTDNRIDGRAVVVTVSDLHINSTVALCPAVINLDDGGTYHASRTQHELGEAFSDLWGRVDRQYPRNEWRRIVIFDGDLGELDTKKRSVQLISLNKATVESTIIDTIEPAIDFADKVVFVRGTPAHTGKSSWIEESIAKDFDKVERVTDDRYSWDHIRPTIERVRFDILHTGNLSASKWARYASAARLAENIMWDYTVELKQPAPQIVIRGHRHTIAHADTDDIEVWYLPAWTVKTEYAYRAGYENKVSDIGGLVIECEGGQKKCNMIRYELKGERRLWKLKL